MAACGYVDTDLGELPLVRAGILASVDGAQTVPRAELTAACLALEVNRAPHLTLIVDASYIIRGFIRGPRNLARFSNPDLWARFWTAVQKRGGRDTLTFEKVKSHLTAAEVLMGIPLTAASSSTMRLTPSLTWQALRRNCPLPSSRNIGPPTKGSGRSRSGSSLRMGRP